MTKEQAIDTIKCLAWHRRPEEEEIEQAIETLEQQPCDDCVDRNHVIATISHHHFDKDKDNFDLLIHNLCKEVKELPPVTPTHGICKNCKRYNRNEMFCTWHGGYLMQKCDPDFYCADFEKARQLS